MDSLPDEEVAGLEAIWAQYKVPIVLGMTSICIILISLVILVKSIQTTTPIQFSTSDVVGSASASLKTILVDVEGAVMYPGVYELSVGARVEDAIEAAGGISDTVDVQKFSQTMNRAMKVADGMKVYIPETSYNNEAVVVPPQESSQNGGVVSVNFASETELDLLPGVGPVTAQKIIDNRPYASLEELVTKKAIGPSLYEKLKNNLSL
jgi:competence protein ComEA